MNRHAASDVRRAMSPHRWWPLLFLSLLLAGLPAVEAQRFGAFSVAIRNPLSQVRPGAPAWVVVELAATDRLRTGRLHLTVQDGQETVARLTTPEWTIAGNVRRELVVLPPLACDRAGGKLDLALRWQDDQGAVDLGRHVFALDSHVARQPLMVLAGDGLVDEGATCRRLLLDRCLPTPAAAHSQHTLRSIVARLDAAELPDRALAYAALDVLVLPAAVVARLTPAQCAAIATWVRAGGALVLFVDDATTLAFPGLTLPTPGSDGHGRGGDGLGRVVVAPRDDGADGIAWRASTAWLWRVRSDRSDAMVATGGWQLKDLGIDKDAPYSSSFARGGHAGLSGALTQALWPDSMHVVPLPVIIGIFVVFVLLVGPVDWWLLGLIRRRRWTWITFPVTALAVTVFTVGLSRHYLGSHDETRVLEVIDVDAAGTALRRNRIELHIAGAATDLELELDQELAGSASGGSGNAYRRSQYQYDHDGMDAAGLAVTGPVTGRNRVVRQLAQWSPTLIRRLRLGGGTPAFAWPASIKGWGNQELERLARDGTGVAILRQSTLVTGALAAFLRQQGMKERLEMFEGLIRFTCGCDDEGWSRITAGSAPLGGFPCDDLPVLDRSDRRQALLVVVERTEEGFRMLRRLYPDDTPLPPQVPKPHGSTSDEATVE